MEVVAVAGLGLVPVVAVSFARGLCVQPSLRLLGKRAGICGASVATGYGSVKLVEGHSEATRQWSGPVVAGTFITGTMSGSWTAGHAARCAVQLSYEALTGGPRV